MTEHTTHQSLNEIPYGYCHCGCGQKTRIAEWSRKRSGDVRGQPIRFINGHNARRNIEERFWEKVNKDGPTHPNCEAQCWVWAGSLNTKGYGLISSNGGNIVTHRISYELHNGSIPDGLLVLHRCDRPSCVNPNHLFLGTHQDNMDDMAAKGRSTRGKPAWNKGR